MTYTQNYWDDRAGLRDIVQFNERTLSLSHTHTHIYQKGDGNESSSKGRNGDGNHNGEEREGGNRRALISATSGKKENSRPDTCHSARGIIYTLYSIHCR